MSRAAPAGAGPRLAFVYRTGGPVEGTPARGGGAFLVGSYDGRLHAIDALGRKRWEYQVGGPIHGGPVCTRTAVYFTQISAGKQMRGEAFALALEPTRLLWRARVAGLAKARPAVSKDLVLVGTWTSRSGTVEALDRRTGEVRWARRLPEAFIDAPGLCADGLYVVGALDGCLYALDLADGRERWRCAALGRMIGSTPVRVGDVLLVGTDGGATGALHGVEVATGRRRFTCRARGGVRTACVDGRTAYFASMDGFLRALDLETRKVRWRAAVSEGLLGTLATPVLAAGVVYVGSEDGHLYAIDAATGERRWRFATEGGAFRGRILGAPLIAGRKIIFGSSDGNVYGLRLPGRA